MSLKHQVSLSVPPELNSIVVAICERQSVGTARMSKAKVLTEAVRLGLGALAADLNIPAPGNLPK